MPHCQVCDRHWTPTSMRPDGTCPTCGHALEARGEPAASRALDGPDEEPVPSAPWHFKVMLVALAIYLAWRAVQGIGWVAAHL